MIAHNLEALYSEHATRFSRNLEKIGKSQEERLYMACLLELGYTTYTFL